MDISLHTVGAVHVKACIIGHLSDLEIVVVTGAGHGVLLDITHRHRRSWPP